jgi:hypothetical protein
MEKISLPIKKINDLIIINQSYAVVINKFS